MKHTGTQELQTKRLVLRRFREEDAEAVYRNYGGDPAVNRYISYTPCLTKKATREFLQMNMDRYETDPDFYSWAITMDDVIVGTIGLFHVSPEADSCELGYTIGSKWWGDGLATEAAGAVIRFAFREMEMHRVYGSHHLDNTASGIVLVNNGMKYEGILRHGQKNPDGTYSDLKLYAILASDPAAQAGNRS